MKKVWSMLCGVTLLSAVWSFAHCEIPCGIYDDAERFTALNEDILTIEKSMKEIQGLSTLEDVNYNQIVRWVENKEVHADHIRATVTEYFLAQRVKPVSSSESKAYNKYVKNLELLHGMIIHAMKAKQTTEIEYVNRLRQDLAQFKASYLGEDDQKHLAEHLDGHKH